MLSSDDRIWLLIYPEFYYFIFRHWKERHHSQLQTKYKWKESRRVRVIHKTILELLRIVILTWVLRHNGNYDLSVKCFEDKLLYDVFISPSPYC